MVSTQTATNGVDQTAVEKPPSQIQSILDRGPGGMQKGRITKYRPFPKLTYPTGNGRCGSSTRPPFGAASICATAIRRWLFQ